MEESIYKLYVMASDFINDYEKKYSENEIINTACEVLMFNPEFKDLYTRCVYLANGWYPETFDERYELAYELIEEISGTLGEYLDK